MNNQTSGESTNGAFGSFVFLYLLFMIPTYVLPYLGSNSAVLGAAGAAAGFAFSPQFVVHAISLLVLIWLALKRGKAVDKQWIVIFPIIAAFFDMMPGINLIPLIPTFMHIGALVVGASGKNTWVA